MHQVRRSLLIPAAPVLTAALTLAAALLPASPAQASTTSWRVNHRVKLGAVTIIASTEGCGRRVEGRYAVRPLLEAL